MALNDIEQRLARLRARVEKTCASVNRDPASVELVAVSKGHPVEAIEVAYDLGLRVFGENYAQDLAVKAKGLVNRPDIVWRFIGHLQRNKATLVDRARATVDTLDSVRVAEAISTRAEARHARTEVLIQVNVGGEPQKSGCTPEALPALVDDVRALGGLALRGLMTVAPHTEDPRQARPHFATLRQLAHAHGLSTLSMGMTHDLEAAIAEGSTMLRVGTGIFGARR